MIDLSGTYTSEFRLMKINTQTWADEERVPGTIEAKIDRNCTDDYPLLETGTYTIDTGINEDLAQGWYRLEMLVTDPSGNHDLIELCTQRLQSGSGLINYGHDAKSVTGQSVLQPMSKRKMAVGKHVPKGVNAVEWVMQLFEATPAPVRVLGNGFTVDQHYVFDPGTTWLRAAWDVLRLDDWCMQIDGSGLITLRPKPENAAIVLDESTKGLLLPGINYKFDLSDVPNHYVAIAEDGTEMEVWNDQADSQTSLSAREGLVQDYVDLSPIPVDGEGLYGYVRRRLEEESTVSREFSYTRSFVDGVVPFDIVSAIIPSDGMLGDLRVQSQSLTCTRGVMVTETAAEEVKEYVR